MQCSQTRTGQAGAGIDLGQKSIGVGAMTYQEILEGITRHRASTPPSTPATMDIYRKIDEIEWALQALAEKLRDDNPQ